MKRNDLQTKTWQSIGFWNGISYVPLLKKNKNTFAAKYLSLYPFKYMEKALF